MPIEFTDYFGIRSTSFEHFLGIHIRFNGAVIVCDGNMDWINGRMVEDDFCFCFCDISLLNVDVYVNLSTQHILNTL